MPLGQVVHVAPLSCPLQYEVAQAQGRKRSHRRLFIEVTPHEAPEETMSAAPPAKVAKLTTAVKFRDEVVINPGNYGFTDDGTLRHRGEDHHQFKFVDQVSYDQLADEVLAYCQGLLDEVLEGSVGGDGIRTWRSAEGGEGKGDEPAPAKRRTMLLLQGSGRVRVSVLPPKSRQCPRKTA